MRTETLTVPGACDPGASCGGLTMLAFLSRMMLQHSGPSLADISCSALVPCLSPPATLTLDDFTNFTPIVKEELRLAIHNKRLSSGLGVDLSSDGTSSSSDRPSEHLAAESGYRREVRLRVPPTVPAFTGAEVTRLLCPLQVSPQEVERRKRRRERNKIAAAKCRNKKKEKTESLQKVLLFEKVPPLEPTEADLQAALSLVSHCNQGSTLL